jgi:hypothetical protein
MEPTKRRIAFCRNATIANRKFTIHVDLPVARGEPTTIDAATSSGQRKKMRHRRVVKD